MFVPYFDVNYLLFSLPAIIVGLAATLLLKYWTGKYNQVANINKLTGVDVAQEIAERNHYIIRLNVTEANLADNYNPGNRTLTLSREVAQRPSVTSLGIAAHEMGHVAQHNQGSLLMAARTAIVPAVSIGSNLGYLLLIIGIIVGMTQLAWVGIGLFSLATVFTLITLPVELDASSRALILLRDNQLIYATEVGGVRRVLFAAALTYMAATLQSLGSLLYFVLRVQSLGGKRRN